MNLKDFFCKTCDLSIFSKERASLMGIAMIWIMLFHTFFLIEPTNLLIAFIKKGYYGVELFLFASGFGLFHSLSKTPSFFPFYKKRLLRILPVYLLIAVPFFIYLWVSDGSGFNNFLLRVSTLCIFKKEIYFWFIFLIIICYLIAPFYFRIISRCKISIVIILPYFVFGLLHVFVQIKPSLELVLHRIPAFLLGMNIALCAFRNIKIKPMILLLVLFVLSIGTIIYISILPSSLLYIVRFIHLIILPFISWGACFVFSNCKRLSSLLSFVGTITLELYMIHEHIVYTITQNLFKNMILSAIVSIAVALVCAFTLHKFLKIIK